jgi:hypothetical protein
MVRVLLVVGFCHGCSFAWHDAHVHTPSTSESDCPSYARPALDVVGAGALTVLAGEAYVHRNDADSAAEIWVVPLALAAIAYATSAAYGFVEPGRCDRGLAEQRQRTLETERRALEAEQRTEADRAGLRRIHARDQAWLRMRAAADAARNGDCVTVRAASDDVRVLDTEFHATVFVRDAAIARCLAP